MNTLDSTIKEKFISSIFDYPIFSDGNIIQNLLAVKDINMNNIHESAYIHPSAMIHNSIIGSNVEIYEGVTIRNSIIFENTVIGHNSEISRSIILKDAMVPRFNYIGKSLIGERVRFGGLAMTATRRHDDSPVKLNLLDQVIDLNEWKFGCIIGSDSIIGYSCHINPGISIGKNCIIGSYIDLLVSIPENSIIQKVQQLKRIDNNLLINKKEVSYGKEYKNFK